MTSYKNLHITATQEIKQLHKLIKTEYIKKAGIRWVGAMQKFLYDVSHYIQIYGGR